MRTAVTLPQWRTWLEGSSMINKFPSVRSLLILFAALVLAYHPCRNLTGLLALSVVALVGFVARPQTAWRRRRRGGGNPALPGKGQAPEFQNLV